MSRVVEPGDQEARRAALDPSGSFIVQAPAGSGKTELLIQRYLVLLSIANQPEEIAAITFTRKAAAEMKNRVLAALEEARAAGSDGGLPGLAPHQQMTRRLALAALQQDRMHGWDLANHAARLKIQTMDALCASLTRQMPVLSAFGAQPESLDDARALYAQAARATLDLLDEENDSANDVALLLEHLDNNLAAAEDLIASMLARRDHWLRSLVHGENRGALEAALAAVRAGARAGVVRRLPRGLHAELLSLLDYASLNLENDNRASLVRACWHLKAVPANDETGHDAWLGIAELLLTKDGGWRKPGGLNAGLGFPPGEGKEGKVQARAWKDRLAALIASLGESDALRDALDTLRRLPAAAYEERQWRVLGAILRLMPLAVAQLKLVFAARGEADFVEIAQRASLCLGSAEAPTDLMLALDYRIRHLLVDEFQDTSLTQFELLEKLTQGWAMDGGGEARDSSRTLFLVGDPMQSIYRFREAEVGLFLKAREEGLSGMALEPLALSANFRSQAGIVDWVNRSFQLVLSAGDDMATGAVRYSPSLAVHAAEAEPVGIHAFLDGDPAAEASRVAGLVSRAFADEPEGKVAILVRNRGHLRAIVPALRDAGLAFRAIEIEALGQRQSIQDLFALTRAIEHLDDRAAWLSVLRAPWCGLTLSDLLALTGYEPRGDAAKSENLKDLFGDIAEQRPLQSNLNIENGMTTLWEAMRDAGRASRLSNDGATRLSRVVHALQAIIDNPLRGGLRERVERAWLALGGPACVADDTDLADIDIYLDCLEEHEAAGAIADVEAFEQAVDKLYALPDVHASDRLQIMTIHKAKGLEFDTVIVPSLGAGSGRDDRGLLAWMEVPAMHGLNPGGAEDTQLLLAPINASGADNEPIYEYLRRLDRIKGRHEEGRLLYVAATRARRHLHLLGSVGRDQEGAPREPVAGSLLLRLWPAVADEFAEQAAQPDQPAAPSHTADVRPSRSTWINRLPSAWQMPAMPPAVAWLEPVANDPGLQTLEFSWAGELARHVGSVVHRWMQRLAEDQLQGWDAGRIDALRDAFNRELAVRGVDEAQCATAAERVANALNRTLADPRGRWLLGAQKEARNEYRLGSYAAGERFESVIDRTFVDHHGHRWIVDYKTSSHEGSDVEAFLDREQTRYSPQLERYARLLGGGTPVHLGLYFPLLNGWREWRAEGGATQPP